MKKFVLQVRKDESEPWEYVARGRLQVPGTIVTTDDPEQAASAIDMAYFVKRDCANYYRKVGIDR